MTVKEVSTFKFDVFGKVREVVKVQLEEPRKEILVVDIFPRDDSVREIEGIVKKLKESGYDCITDTASRKIVCTGADLKWG